MAEGERRGEMVEEMVLRRLREGGVTMALLLALRCRQYCPLPPSPDNLPSSKEEITPSSSQYREAFSAD